MSKIDLTHLQALAEAGQAEQDPEILAQVEALLGRVLAGGARATLNRYDFYATPQAVVKEALDNLAKTDYEIETILEPSAGTGAWLDELRCRWPQAHINVIEKNPLNRLALQERDDVRIVGEDFLAYRRKDKYDLIVGNPPFGDDGDQLVWAKHMAHAKGMLTPRGQMMMVAPVGLTFRRDKPIKELRETFTTHELPKGAFKESGTAANVVLAWFSQNDALERPFQEAKSQPDKRSQPPQPAKTAAEAAANLARVFRNTERIIDTTIADMERYQAKGKAGLLLEWNTKQGAYEDWPNQATWMVHILVTQDRLAYETMRKIVPTLKGSRAKRATALHLMWTSFCAETTISSEFRTAFSGNGLSRETIDWSALLDDWDRIAREE
jgi:hypothetical protein